MALNKEKAELGNLEKLLSTIGAGLDQYIEFKHDDAVVNIDNWMAALDQPLPQQGTGIEKVTRDLVEQVIANGSPVPKPGFTSYITTGATTASTLALTAASIASPQRYMPTAFNFLEELSLDWMAQMFGLGAMKGIYSSGGSVANLIALGAARQSAFEKLGHDPASHGVNRSVSIYATAECHNTIKRSAGVLGLGRRAVKAIGCDERGRMRADKLILAIEADQAEGIMPMAIVANVGTTNTGAIDPLQEIGEIAERYGIWFHVDGAYGLPGILDERLASLYQGLAMVDSIIVDPHKWLGSNVGIAATFVHDRSLLERAFTQEPADYLEGSIAQNESGDAALIVHSMDDFGIPYFNYGIELSAPCRGIAVWAMICEIGVEGLRERIKRHNDMARDVADFAEQHAKLELLQTPTLSVVCFRYIGNGNGDIDVLNQRLHRKLVRENEFMPSTTRINGKLALRPCFIGARSEDDQVDGLLQAVLRIGAEIEKGEKYENEVEMAESAR